METLRRAVKEGRDTPSMLGRKRYVPTAMTDVLAENIRARRMLDVIVPPYLVLAWANKMLSDSPEVF